MVENIFGIVPCEDGSERVRSERERVSTRASDHVSPCLNRARTYIETSRIHIL